jgi:ABC-type nitrate/sulfonate/bicarbonate transport system ATPase subunit
MIHVYSSGSLSSQSPSLVPWLTELENVALPLRARGMPKREAEEHARRSLSGRASGV